MLYKNDDFKTKIERLPNQDGTFRCKTTLTRFPDHHYPRIVDGLKKVTQPSMDLNHWRTEYNILKMLSYEQVFTKELMTGVHERINDRIQKGTMKVVGS